MAKRNNGLNCEIVFKKLKITHMLRINDPSCRKNYIKEKKIQGPTEI